MHSHRDKHASQDLLALVAFEVMLSKRDHHGRMADDGLLGRGDAGTLFTTNIVSDPDDASPRQSRLR